MANRDNRKNIKDERVEDTTMYGEFIPSFDQWMTPDRQRALSHNLEKVTEEITTEDNKKIHKKQSN